LRRAVQDGDVDNGSMMAGQSIGLVKKIESVQDIIDQLAGEMETEFQRVKKSLQA
jgi:enoyl-[acyl-carrier protein] reductase II